MRHKKWQDTAIRLLYSAAVIMVLFLLIYIALFEKANIFQKRQSNGYDTITEYQYQELSDDNAPAGLKKEYKFTLTKIDYGENCLAFYLVHQSAEVYFDDELMYKLGSDENNKISKTPGCNWVVVPVYPEDFGKEVRINVYPAYKSVEGKNVSFLLGSQLEIYKNRLKKDLPAIVLGSAAVIVGIIFVVISFFHIYKIKRDKTLLYLGLLSISIGLWKAFDTRFIPLAFPKASVLTTYIPLSMLLLSVVSWVLFVKAMFNKKNYIVLDIAGFGTAAASIILLILQFAGITDLRESLIVCHIMIVFSAVSIGLGLIYFWRKKEAHYHIKLSVVCLLLCIAGVCLDMVYFYAKDTSVTAFGGFSMVLFYILMMGIASIDQLRKKAYIDLQTGLYNRSRCNEFLKDEGYVVDNTGLIMFDLNHLKKINDTQGHSVGDYLIVNFAKILQRNAPSGSFVGRYGGDEFIIILKNTSSDKIEGVLKKIADMTEDFNNQDQKVFMSYACGYSISEKSKSYTLKSLLDQADYNMYLDKKRYHEENEQ